MELERSVNCRQIMKCEVYDSEGKKLGHIGDMTFKFEDALVFSQFILAGPKWEEFLETIGAKPDRDPIFDASLIAKMGDRIVLSTPAKNLKTTLDEGIIPEDNIRLSKLKKMDILDENDEWVGRAIGANFNLDGSVSIIVGGGVIEEALEAVGFKSDVDIIVPGDVIGTIDESVKLKVSKDELSRTMEAALKKPEVIRVKSDKSVHESVTKVRLFTQRPY
ncbi:MAG: hypothetical protein EAX95_02410 [Candidatus Thorarchaeota archaeon]|nr:hypothetical protein [Candidatus Thorarchaeota archaeon]